MSPPISTKLFHHDDVCGTSLDMSNYRELAVWRKSHSVALDVYRVSLELPKTERYGLQAQMRRAAVSIGSNLAEGSGRASDRDFARFVSIAIGSASELEYQLELAEDLDFLERELAQRRDSESLRSARCCSRCASTSFGPTRDSRLATHSSQLSQQLTYPP